MGRDVRATEAKVATADGWTDERWWYSDDDVFSLVCLFY